MEIVEQNLEISKEELADKMRSSLVKYFGQHDWNAFNYISMYVEGFINSLESGKEMDTEDVKKLKFLYERQQEYVKIAESKVCKFLKLFGFFK